MADRIYLDCSGLRDIRVNGNDIPRSIQIEGYDFLQRLESLVDRMTAPVIVEIDEIDTIKKALVLLNAEKEIEDKFGALYRREASIETEKLIIKTELSIQQQIKKLNQ